MTFMVNQKIVCVDSSSRPGRYWRGDVPIVGAVYTVMAIGVDEDGEIDLSLLEIKNSEYWNGRYRAARFRPAVSPKSETSFTQRAPKDSEKWDCRRKIPVRERAWGCSAKYRHNAGHEIRSQFTH